MILTVIAPGKPQKSNVMIVDDHPIVRQGIAQLINREDDLQVCCEAGSAEQALEELTKCKCNRFDIALVDMSLPGTSGLDLIKILRAREPQMHVLVVSMHDESLYAERVLRAGAKGYIMKQEASEKVLTAIRQVLNGGVYVSDKIHAKILRGFVENRVDASVFPLSHLSDKELEILRLIGMGLKTRSIAAELGRSVKTIEAHRANIKRKLKLSNAAELVKFAVQWMEGEA